MNRTLPILVPVLALILLTGCSGPVGTWQMHKIEPSTAANDFPMQTIELASDHTFSARIGKGDDARKITGTWEYDQKAERLTFHSSDGTDRVYHAEICPGCGEMYISHPSADSHWKATMKRK